MQYIDTSPAAIERRAQQSMAGKHLVLMSAHEHRFGKLGELQTKKQKQALQRFLAERERNR